MIKSNFIQILTSLFSILLLQPVSSQTCYINQFPFVDSTDVYCGDSLDLTIKLSGFILPPQTFSDSALSPLFEPLSGTPNFSSGCNTSTSDASLWIDSTFTGLRSISTVNLDLTDALEVGFEFAMGIQGFAYPCEGPDLPSEGITLEFSIDNGVTWTQIDYYTPNTSGSFNSAFVNSGDYTGWAHYSYALPTAAKQPNTKIRWTQYTVTGGSFDLWGLDSIYITGDFNYNNVSYSWNTGDTSNQTSLIGITDTTVVNCQVSGLVNNNSFSCLSEIVLTPLYPTQEIQPLFAQACRGEETELLATNAVNFDPSVAYSREWFPIGAFTSTSFNSALLDTLNEDTTIWAVLIHPDYPACNSVDSTLVDYGGPSFDSLEIFAPCDQSPQNTGGATVWFSNDGISPPILRYFRNGINFLPPPLDSSGIQLSGLAAGDSIMLTLEDAICADTIRFVVPQAQPLQLDPTVLTTPYCIGQEFALYPDATIGLPPYQFLNEGVLMDSIVLTAFQNDTTFNVQIVSANGCQSDTQSVTLSAYGDLSFIVASTSLCVGDSFTLSVDNLPAQGSFQYNWSTGDTTLSVNGLTANTNYSVTVTDQCGQSSSTSVSPPNFAGTQWIWDTAVCVGEQPSFQQVNSQLDGFLISIGSDTYSELPVVWSTSIQGNYPLTIDSYIGDCVTSENGQISVIQIPEADFYFDTEAPYSLGVNNTVLFEEQTAGADSFFWVVDSINYEQQTLLEVEFTVKGNYTASLIAQAAGLCYDTAVKTVPILEAPPLFIPTAFTPNGDGLNDNWQVYLPPFVESVELLVFNHLGVLIHENTYKDYIDWNGKGKGGLVGQAGIYQYILNINYTSPSITDPEEQRGQLTLRK